jgi:hypothetical protein
MKKLWHEDLIFHKTFFKFNCIPAPPNAGNKPVVEGRSGSGEISTRDDYGKMSI